jgi:3D (Asp-Asp-Asp) domain-containing protein
MTKYIRTALILAIALTTGCCFLRSLRQPRIRPPDRPPQTVTLETTGYCPCGKCCGWKRNWWGRPVFASGPLKGRPKEVGVTASGTKARKGTIAADTDRYPFGTIMYVPGYGYGRVEDRGGAIKGAKIDLFFKHHSEALEWGRERRQVQVWLPR